MVVVADQEFLTTKASIADIATKVEKDKRESVGNLLRPMMCRPEWFTLLS
jgi:hypothetical protein